MATGSNVLTEIGRVQTSVVTRRLKWKPSRVLVFALMCVLAVFFFFPFFWTLMSSLKRITELNTFPPTWLPASPQWVNYQTVLTGVPFMLWTYNTLFISALSMLGTIITASLVAYSFARFRYRGRDFIFMLTLGTLMLPAQVTLIPQFVLFHRLNMINTLTPLWLPAWFGGGAFAIFLLRQFIMTLPKELDEAALIDASEAFLTESTAMLAHLRGELTEIDAANDLTRKRAVIEAYVRQITVETRRIGPRKLEADVRVCLRLQPAPIAIETSIRQPGDNASRCDGPALGR